MLAGNYSINSLDSNITIFSTALFSRNFLILFVILSGSCASLAIVERVDSFEVISEELTSLVKMIDCKLPIIKE